jgi:hypothetical protein
MNLDAWLEGRSNRGGNEEGGRLKEGGSRTENGRREMEEDKNEDTMEGR